MRIVILGACNSIHVIRWVNALAKKGHKIYLISMQRSKVGLDKLDKKVNVYHLPIQGWIGYFLNTPVIKKMLFALKPDVMHAHYASGYGTLARLSNFHPYILSAWGSDVYEFPFKSPMHKRILVNNLQAPDWLCSTSHIMKEQILSLFNTSKISVVPFGVDTSLFKNIDNHCRQNREIVVGTVKTLARQYGIDILICAFALARENIIKKNCEEKYKMRLMIVGEGPDELKLKNLVQRLQVDKMTTFLGAVPYLDVPKYLNSMDIYVAVSRRESFGVAVIEAMACALPVIVSDADGFKETVKDKITGMIVPRENVEATAEAICRLVMDINLRCQLGSRGRSYVQRKYEWSQNVSKMEQIYERLIKPNIGYN